MSAKAIACERNAWSWCGGPRIVQRGGGTKMREMKLIRCLMMVAAAALAVSGTAAEKSASGKKAAEKKGGVDEKALTLQVWLDRQNLGPGKIDGKGGEFT